MMVEDWGVDPDDDDIKEGAMPIYTLHGRPAETVEELADLLRSAETAHKQAEDAAKVTGRPLAYAWPEWYARYMLAGSPRPAPVPDGVKYGQE